MLGTIIISLDSDKLFTENFLYILAHYPQISNYKIIMTDDGNTLTDYAKLVRQYFHDDNCKFIHNEVKQGYGIVNNNAARYATTDILIFMNADVILKKNCLEELLRPFNIMDVDAVQPLLIYPQNNLVQSTGHVLCKYYNSHLFENRSIFDSIVQEDGYRAAFTTALCAVKKNIFEKYNGFNEEYFNAWEGMELGLRITHDGGKCYYNPRSKAYHIRGGGRGQYKIDERPQSAHFWSFWGDKIRENIAPYLNAQLVEIPISDCYCIINFSCIIDLKHIIKKLNINIVNVVEYIELAGFTSIEFFKTMPYFWLNYNKSILFVTNNFTVIKNNVLWFWYRKHHRDIIIDLSGNCIPCSEFYQNLDSSI